MKYIIGAYAAAPSLVSDNKLVEREFYNHRRFHQTLDYKKPMDVYQESIKLNQNKKKAS